MRVLLLSMLIATPAPAQRAEIGWEDLEPLRLAVGSCRDDSLRGTGHHVPDPHRELVHLLGAMLEIDPARCPGVAAAAAAALPGLLGEPERGDVDLELLQLAWQAAERGQGMPADPALADRYGRMLWLFDEFEPSLPRWSRAEREAWLVRPETVALLAARHATDHFGTRRSLSFEGELRLRRDLPYYDAARAIDLLSRGPVINDYAARHRVSRMMTDGVLVPADYRRAADMYLWSASLLQGYPEMQGELLRIGRAASAAARTPAERAQALHILFAASLNGLEGSREAVAEELARIGRPRRTTLETGDAKEIERRMTEDLDFGIVLEDDPPRIQPIRLRGLIGPDGRLAYAEVVGSSGSWYRDRAALGGWAQYGDRVDLSATAQGRFTWVELPPVDSRPD